MATATSRVPEFLQRRRFAGALLDADVIGGANVEGRPPEVVIFLKLRDGAIADAGFQTSGCGYLIACCSAVLEMAVGRPLAACHSFDVADLIAYLGGLPEQKHYCAALAVLGLRNALAKVSPTAGSKAGAT